MIQLLVFVWLDMIMVNLIISMIIKLLLLCLGLRYVKVNLVIKRLEMLVILVFIVLL